MARCVSWTEEQQNLKMMLDDEKEAKQEVMERRDGHGDDEDGHGDAKRVKIEDEGAATTPGSSGRTFDSIRWGVDSVAPVKSELLDGTVVRVADLRRPQEDYVRMWEDVQRHLAAKYVLSAEKNLANTTPMYESSKTYDRGGNEVVGIKECEQPPLEKYLNLK